jgi:hypothetical protein
MSALTGYRTIAGFQIRKGRLRRRQSECDAVTLMQSFGGALNLNVHFTCWYPTGVCAHGPADNTARRT